MNFILIIPLALTINLKEIQGTEGHIKRHLWECSNKIQTVGTPGQLLNFFMNSNKEKKRKRQPIDERKLKGNVNQL